LLAPGKKKTTFLFATRRERRRARKLIHLLGNHLRIFIATKHCTKAVVCIEMSLAYFLSDSVCKHRKAVRRSFAAAGVGRARREKIPAGETEKAARCIKWRNKVTQKLQ
jgi:hypothetical protein